MIWVYNKCKVIKMEFPPCSLVLTIYKIICWQHSFKSTRIVQKNMFKTEDKNWVTRVRKCFVNKELPVFSIYIIYIYFVHGMVVSNTCTINIIKVTIKTICKSFSFFWLICFCVFLLIFFCLLLNTFLRLLEDRNAINNIFWDERLSRKFNVLPRL